MEKQSHIYILPVQKPSGCCRTACVRRNLRLGGLAERWIHTQGNEGYRKVGSWKGMSKITLYGAKLEWSRIPRRKNRSPAPAITNQNHGQIGFGGAGSRSQKAKLPLLQKALALERLAFPTENDNTQEISPSSFIISTQPWFWCCTMMCY